MSETQTETKSVIEHTIGTTYIHYCNLNCIFLIIILNIMNAMTNINAAIYSNSSIKGQFKILNNIAWDL